MEIFCSQYKDINIEEWKNRACSICALWMAIKSFKEDFDLTPDELLKEGLAINGYLEGGFWKHQSLAILAHNHGLGAYIEEFKSAPFGKATKYDQDILNYGVEKIFNFLKNKEGVVLVSVPKDFGNLDRPHTILFHGVKEIDGKKYFIYNDSEKDSIETGQDLSISFEDFQKKWRKLAIFLSSLKI